MRGLSMRAALLCLAVVAVMAVCAAPVTAITYGEPDNGRHPNVGMVVVGYADADGGYVTRPVASGTLIAPEVFLTAGHVWEYIDSSHLDFWVTFEPVFVPFDYGHWRTGTIVPHPDYRSVNLDNDLAVVLLDYEVSDIVPALLPPAGLLDSLAAAATLRDQTFTCVGYGLQERVHPQTGPPSSYGGGERRQAVSAFSALEKQWLHASQIQAQGEGGISTGDSGGPFFLNLPGHDTTIVAIASWTAGHAQSMSYRLDTPSALSFLLQYTARQ